VLIAAIHAGCVVQFLLVWVQLGAALGHLDVMHLAPTWLPTALSALLFTAQSSSSWVAWECMQGTTSTYPAEVARTLFNLFLPGMAEK
jgi:hypothetical protein